MPTRVCVLCHPASAAPPRPLQLLPLDDGLIERSRSMAPEEAASKAKELLAGNPDIHNQVEQLLTTSAKALLEAGPSSNK